MKKQLLLVAIAVLSVFAVKAGDKDLMFRGGGGGDSKLTIGISVGAALPGSDWAAKAKNTSNDSTKRPDGFAMTGFHFDLTAGYQIAGPVGAMILIGGNLNNFDAATYKSVYNYPSSETFSATNYYSGQYMVGPFISVGGDNFKFNVRVLVGLITCSSPTFTSSGTFFGSTVTDVQSGNDGSGFGYQFGAGIKYNFTSSMGLLVNVDYVGSTITYTGYKDVQTSGSNSTTTTNTTLKQTMGYNNITASVGIAFNL